MMRWSISSEDWNDAVASAKSNPPRWAVRVLAVLLLAWWYAHEVWHFHILRRK
jgi:hypothetical protein